MNKRLLSDMLRIAQDYLPRHPQFKYYPVYSFIVQDNAVVEWSTNAAGDPTGPLRAMYEARVAHLDGRPKIHAEVRAYSKARGLLKRDKSFEVANIRLNRKGQIRMAAPCNCCHCFLKSLGATKAYFTTDYGWANMTLDKP